MPKNINYGDGFKPHKLLEPFSSSFGQLFCFDSKISFGNSVVVLVHGNGDEADTWRHIFTPLAKSFRVLAPDLPGFGRSEPTGNGNLENLTLSLSSFISALKEPRVHLVGSSLGAIVSALYASQNPQQVLSLSLVGGAPVKLTPNTGIQRLLEPEIGENYYNGLRTLGQDAAFASLEPYYANLESLPETDLEFLRARVWARVWSDTQRTAFFAALRSLFDPIITNLELVNILLIWGEQDNIMPLTTAQTMLQNLPQAKLEIIQNAGHLPHQEQPEAFVQILETFLKNAEAN